MGAVIRPPVSLLMAGLAVLIGMAGLVRGAIPQAAAGGRTAGSAVAAAIVVGGAYLREPANLTNAAAYFTVHNNSDSPDTLVSVASGAGSSATLHTDAAGAMAVSGGGIPIPAHGSIALSPGKGHVMIDHLYGVLKPGQTVSIELTFAHAGEVLATAPVIGIAATAPTAVEPK
jgi:copper(I)-binding protein